MTELVSTLNANERSYLVLVHRIPSFTRSLDKCEFVWITLNKALHKVDLLERRYDLFSPLENRVNPDRPKLPCDPALAEPR